MRTHLKAALASLLILGSGAAAAADLSMAKFLPRAPALPAFYDWSGFYIGAQAGYSWGNERMKQLYRAGGLPLSAVFSHDNDTALGGVHVGYNYQIGAIVLGAEADLEGVNARGRFNDPDSVRVKRDWQASVRGRIGYAFDNVMVYGTAGASFSDFDYARFNPFARVGEAGSASRTGWTAGGGVNYAFTGNIIMGLDYRYTDYGKFASAARNTLPSATAEQNPTMHTLRASLAYKF